MVMVTRTNEHGANELVELTSYISDSDAQRLAATTHVLNNLPAIADRAETYEDSAEMVCEAYTAIGNVYDAIAAEGW